LPAINQASCIDPSAQRQTGIVTQVMDGNTIHVQIDGKDYVVRYIGIAVPEAGAAGATAAMSYNSQLLMGKPVTLIRDVSETDAGGRLLRYVLVENVFVNYVLVSHGLAVAKSDSLDTACDQVFVDAQKQAKVNQMGLWLPTITPVPYVPPIVVPTPTAANLSNGGNCDSSYPTVCIPPPPPDLDCKDIPYRRFRVLPPDPHHFDGDHDGIGCET
jgi:micrococcal nuclease